MKKYTLCVLSALLINSFTTHASDGQIRFTGSIIPNSCNVDTNYVNQIISLGKVPITTFNGINTTSSATPFSIKLKNCPTEYKKIQIKFDGRRDKTNNALLGLNPSSGGQAATGIAIGIYNQSSLQLLPLNQEMEQHTINKQQEVEVRFIAKYIATGVTITPGNANSLIHFNVIYD